MPPCPSRWGRLWRIYANWPRWLMSDTRRLRLLAIPGDGIGPEVTAAALRVLRATVPAMEIVEAPAGWGTFQETGSALPDETLALARQSDAVLFGAVASPSHP